MHRNVDEINDYYLGVLHQYCVTPNVLYEDAHKALHALQILMDVLKMKR